MPNSSTNYSNSNKSDAAKKLKDPCDQVHHQDSIEFSVINENLVDKEESPDEMISGKCFIFHN